MLFQKKINNYYFKKRIGGTKLFKKKTQANSSPESDFSGCDLLGKLLHILLQINLKKFFDH